MNNTGNRPNRSWSLVISIISCLISASCLIPQFCLGAQTDDPEAGFRNPPASARPWVYWFWLNGNVSKAGITADLEAMQRVGIGGALLMDVGLEIPAGPVPFGGVQWRDLFQHAVAEADRLGLALSINNAAGWTGSGGPWIKPAQSMQKLVCVKTNLLGAGHFSGPLPQLPGFVPGQDVAVLAFPTLVGDGARYPGPAPKVTASTMTGFDGANLIDDDIRTFAVLPSPSPGKPQFLQLEYDHPFKAALLNLAGAPGYPQEFAGHLDISDDGHHFRQVREFRSLTNGLTLVFEASAARFYRVVFAAAQPELKQLRFSHMDLCPIYRIEWAQAKSGLGLMSPGSTEPSSSVSEFPSWARVQPENLLDLTTNLSQNGQLDWNVPTGQWTVLRFSYEPTGQRNHPARQGGEGLECDKLSPQAIEAHFASFLAPLIREAGSAVGRALVATHVDSWEVGFQNWTPRFREEFQRRRGYDPVPYLPAFTGRVVATVEQSERFLWDMRRTVADLVADNYVGHLTQLAHQNGLQLSMEAYDRGPFDDLQCGGRVDVPMAEFWLEGRDLTQFYLRPMPSAAHTNGKRVVAAEAFTSNPPESKWQKHPWLLKPLADVAFCEGINRLVIHRYAHQPWLGPRPGMTMGPFGLEYERSLTWWEFSKPWHEYLARCQFLLQQGLFAADLCYLTSEGAYAKGPTPDPPPPHGFDYDLASPGVVMTRLTVDRGRLVLPDGMSYSLLVLPQTRFMTPNILRRLKSLVEEGAVITGPRPIKSPSLSGYPLCDDEVESLAEQIWGNCDGKTVTEHTLGKGKMVWGRTLQDILASMKLEPDFQQLTATADCPVRHIHRRIGDVEAYFVCAPGLPPAAAALKRNLPQPVTVHCRFRVAGKQPELWHPDTGEIERPAGWLAGNGHTDVPLTLIPGGSVFVVFRQVSPALYPVISMTRNDQPEDSTCVTFAPGAKLRLVTQRGGIYRLRTASGKVLTAVVKDLPQGFQIAGPWDVHFPPGSGAPEHVTLQKLSSWTNNTDAGVRYFSGTATYIKTIQIGPELNQPGQRLILDLGRVQVMASVKLNGKDLGILWKPPFEVDVTANAHPGPNSLEIQVVNLWPNRLIGDEHLPEDCEWQTPSDAGAALVKWPAWLLEGKPSPTGRITFATWKHWTKDSPLLESGLLGPVTLHCLHSTDF